MNVLLFSNLFPSSREPTRGVFNLHGFEPLARSCRVRVVAPVPWWRRRGRLGEWRAASSERWGALESTYPTFWTVPRLAAGFHSSAMYWSVRRHVLELHRQSPFDAVIGSFAYPDTVVAARLARELDCRLVALVLGSDMNILAQQPNLRPQIRSALVQADLVVALTRALRERVLNLGVPGERVVVQHNGVDGNRFRIRDRSEARQRLECSQEDRLLCFVGNLVREKGPDVVLKALAVLHRSRLKARLVFVGDGNLRTQLEMDAARFGISQYVSFVGRQAPDEIPWWMAAADVVCLPSRREGCPNVVLESLACGRPVVASSVGGVPELISDANGIMAPPDDPAALAMALHAALRRSWGADDLRGSVESLSWDAFAAVFLKAICASTNVVPQTRSA